MLNFSFELNQEAECPSKEQLMSDRGYSEEVAAAYIKTHEMVKRRLRRKPGEAVRRRPKKNSPNQNSIPYTGKFNWNGKNSKKVTESPCDIKNISEGLNEEGTVVSSLLNLSALIDASSAAMQPENIHWTPALEKLKKAGAAAARNGNQCRSKMDLMFARGLTSEEADIYIDAYNKVGMTPQRQRILKIKHAAQKMVSLNAPCPSQAALMKRYSAEEIPIYIDAYQKSLQRQHVKQCERILEIEPIHYFQSNRADETNEYDVLFEDGVYFNFGSNEKVASDTDADNMVVATEASIRVISPK